MNYRVERFPDSRIATFDICAVSHLKHHITIMIECDITDSRKKLKELKSAGRKISFFGWLLKVIADSVMDNPHSAAYLHSKRELIIFDTVSISTIFEKEVDGVRVPVPMVIKDANLKSVEEISKEIDDAKNEVVTKKSIVINRKPNAFERIYYLFPGFLRRAIWRYFIRNPKLSKRLMGNVSVTSLGMTGPINAWFIHKSIHPVSIGVGTIMKKPVVVDNEVVIREVMNMTLLIDHDVMDGVPMARFIKDLERRIRIFD